MKADVDAEKTDHRATDDELDPRVANPAPD
jgi:hypothetical protein